MTDTLPQQVINGAISHMNDDHKHNLLDYAKRLAGCDWAEEVEMTAIDGLGFDMLVTGNGREEIKRLTFPHPVSDAKGLRMALVEMAQGDVDGDGDDDEEADGIQQTANAHVATDKGSRYMKALCNHFDRKATAGYTETAGHITFAFGKADIEVVDKGLHILVSAENSELLERTKSVIGSHLIRFGQKDELVVHWK